MLPCPGQRNITLSDHHRHPPPVGCWRQPGSPVLGPQIAVPSHTSSLWTLSRALEHVRSNIPGERQCNSDQADPLSPKRTNQREEEGKEERRTDVRTTRKTEKGGQRKEGRERGAVKGLKRIVTLGY